jgi:hypothetical protein
MLFSEVNPNYTTVMAVNPNEIQERGTIDKLLLSKVIKVALASLLIFCSFMLLNSIASIVISAVILYSIINSINDPNPVSRIIPAPITDLFLKIFCWRKPAIVVEEIQPRSNWFWRTFYYRNSPTLVVQEPRRSYHVRSSSSTQRVPVGNGNVTPQPQRNQPIQPIIRTGYATTKRRTENTRIAVGNETTSRR